MKKRLLSIETATEFCSIALLVGDEMITRSVGIPQKHSLCALPMIDELLAQAGLTLKMLDAIAVGQGPGSFTGVRLAISLAQGLCFGADLPCVPISTLATLAYAGREEARKLGLKVIMSAMDARMQEIYGGLYQLDPQSGGLIALMDDFVQKPAEIDLFKVDNKNVIAIGTGWNENYKAELIASTGLNPIVTIPEATPQACDLARLALIALQSGDSTKIVKPENLMPAYCRNKVTF